MQELEKCLSNKDLTYKPKVNFSYFIASSIMESLCYWSEINIFHSSSRFKEYNFFVDNEEELTGILKEKVNILKEATRLFRVLDLFEYDKRKYNLSTEKWFSENHFYIYDNMVLKELCPILLYYVGNDPEASYSLFFDKLDILIEFTIKAAINHNNSASLENYIIDKINSLEEIEILDENDKEVSVIAKQIKFRKKSQNSIERIFVYEDINTSENKETKIEKVIFNNNIKKETLITNHNMSYFSMFNIEKKEENEIEVILECDTVMYEYYKFKPLKQMKIFETEDKIKDLSLSLEFLKTKVNKFYIIAIDTEEMIVSTLLHTLPYTKVIEPFYLNNRVLDKLKKFADNLDIDICKEDNTPPKQPIKPNNNQTSKNETPIEDSGNIEIDKNGLVEKIKNTKGGDLNL